MTISFPRSGRGRPAGEEITIACVEIARRVSNETGYWWSLTGVGGDLDYIAFEFTPSLWPPETPYPIEI